MKKRIIMSVSIILGIASISILWQVFGIAMRLDSSSVINQAVLDECMQRVYNILKILVVTIIILYFTLSRILNNVTVSLKQLSHDADEFAKGSYYYQLRNYDMEEVQMLANSLDHMGERIDNTIRKLQYQKAKVESLLVKLEEGIIILDPKGCIIEMNDYAKKMLKVNEVYNDKEHINSILRDSKSITILSAAIKQEEDRAYEIVVEDKTFYVTIAPVMYLEKVLQYLLIIRDITKIRKLEEMRYQFVSNVTHELKTPLTSIQGFVETLKEGAIRDEKVALRFLDIIDIEAKRLYSLIQDTLFLSEIENPNQRKLEQTEVTPIAWEVIDLLEKQAMEKNIVLKFIHDEDLILENTNSSDIKQLIINLVSNAIKYTDQGEVVIIAERCQEGKKIAVRDTGIGIAKESIPRIFERFYRVDKGRSRKNGGTGLGLSIVKHIVTLYGGEIQVESEEGIGSTFTVTFRQG